MVMGVDRRRYKESHMNHGRSSALHGQQHRARARPTGSADTRPRPGRGSRGYIRAGTKNRASLGYPALATLATMLMLVTVRGCHGVLGWLRPCPHCTVCTSAVWRPSRRRRQAQAPATGIR